MKTLTLFEAYQRAQDRRERALVDRGSIFGIACKDDALAREWQRYDRLVRKLDLKIQLRLGAPPLEEPLCWFCGYFARVCTCPISKKEAK